VEQSTAETHWILACASPQEFVKAANAGATGLFCGYFKNFLNCRFPASQKNWIFQNRISNALN
jgi:hypothetical protein